MKGFNAKPIKTLGSGSFGRVFLTSDGYAAKLIDKASLMKKSSRGNCIKTEIDLHRTVNHPNIAKLYSVHETNTDIILKLEYVKGQELYRKCATHIKECDAKNLVK